MSTEKNIIGFVTPLAENKFFTFTAFHYLYGIEIETFEREIFDILKFFDNPPKFFVSSMKCIIFNIAGFSEDGEIDYELCQKIAAKLDHLKIPFRFIAEITFLPMCKLIAAKIDPVLDKEILQIFVEDNGEFKQLWLSRKNDGYIITKRKIIRECYDPKILLNSTNLNKIIISGPSSKASKLKKSLSTWNPVVVESPFKQNFFHAVKEIFHHICDSKRNKFFVKPQSFHEFGITFVNKNPSDADVLLFEEDDTYLPFTKSCIVPRFLKTFYVTLKNEESLSILTTPYSITKEGHRFKLTLSTDFNYYPTIIHEAIILPRIQKMPKKLNIEKTEKLPIIGFFDNFSVICLWNENENCYKFMDTWNGKFGKDLFLNFMLPKPRLASSSAEIMSSPAVVYDLIKIMSMPSNEMKVDKNWKFTFTKDAENPVLLEFDTSEEGRKAASPAFLIALILKQHIKAIRKAICGKPAKIGFRLLNDFENLETKKRVEVGLTEACEMLKIECFFV